VKSTRIRDANLHIIENLPVAVLGRGQGNLRPARHSAYFATPMTIFYLTLLDRNGREDRTEKWDPSTGKADRLTGV
jgi:hypothetical protein